MQYYVPIDSSVRYIRVDKFVYNSTSRLVARAMELCTFFFQHIERATSFCTSYFIVQGMKDSTNRVIANNKRSTSFAPQRV